jgi:hypothetical protein
MPLLAVVDADSEPLTPAEILMAKRTLLCGVLAETRKAFTKPGA